MFNGSECHRTARRGRALFGALLGFLVSCTSQPAGTTGPSETSEPPSPPPRPLHPSFRDFHDRA